MIIIPILQFQKLLANRSSQNNEKNIQENPLQSPQTGSSGTKLSFINNKEENLETFLQKLPPSPNQEEKKKYVQHIAEKLGYGYKTAHLMIEERMLAKEIKVKIPEFFPFSHGQVIQLLGKDKTEEIYKCWGQFVKCMEGKVTLSQEGKNVLKEIQKSILSAKNDLNKAIANIKLPPGYYMVRSTGKEDSEKLANPGGNASKACMIKGDGDLEELSKSMLEVLASYFSEKSIQQQMSSQSNSKHTWDPQPFLPILIQKMIGTNYPENFQNPDLKNMVPKSGVLTVEKKEEGELVIRIIANFGHNESVVSGKPGDEYIVSVSGNNKKETISIINNKKLAWHQVTQEGKVESKVMPSSLKDQSVLSEYDIHILCKLAESIQKSFNRDIDIEFTYDPNEKQFYLLQQRPLLLDKRDSAEPTYVDLEKVVELTEKNLVIDGQCAGPRKRNGVLPITTERILFSDTLDEALNQYKSTHHDLVVVNKASNTNSHPSLEFSKPGMPPVVCISNKNWGKIKNHAGPLGFNGQLFQILFLDKSDSVNELKRTGVIASSFSGEFSENNIFIEAIAAMKTNNYQEKVVNAIEQAKNTREEVGKYLTGEKLPSAYEKLTLKNLILMCRGNNVEKKKHAYNAILKELVKWSDAVNKYEFSKDIPFYLEMNSILHEIWNLKNSICNEETPPHAIERLSVLLLSQRTDVKNFYSLVNVAGAYNSIKSGMQKGEFQFTHKGYLIGFANNTLFTEKLKKIWNSMIFSLSDEKIEFLSKVIVGLVSNNFPIALFLNAKLPKIQSGEALIIGLHKILKSHKISAMAEVANDLKNLESESNFDIFSEKIKKISGRLKLLINKEDSENVEGIEFLQTEVYLQFVNAIDAHIKSYFAEHCLHLTTTSPIEPLKQAAIGFGKRVLLMKELLGNDIQSIIMRSEKDTEIFKELATRDQGGDGNETVERRKRGRQKKIEQKLPDGMKINGGGNGYVFTDKVNIEEMKESPEKFIEKLSLEENGAARVCNLFKISENFSAKNAIFFQNSMPPRTLHDYFTAIHQFATSKIISTLYDTSADLNTMPSDTVSHLVGLIPNNLRLDTFKDNNSPYREQFRVQSVILDGRKISVVYGMPLGEHGGIIELTYDKKLQSVSLDGVISGFNENNRMERSEDAFNHAMKNLRETISHAVTYSASSSPIAFKFSIQNVNEKDFREISGAIIDNISLWMAVK